jgi:hypothetical protein
MKGWFDCLECQYENQVGKREKKNQSTCAKIGHNYATCTAFKLWGRRDSLVVLEARFWPPDDTYLLKARITVHSLFLIFFIYQITFVVTQFLISSF